MQVLIATGERRGRAAPFARSQRDELSPRKLLPAFRTLAVREANREAALVGQGPPCVVYHPTEVPWRAKPSTMAHLDPEGIRDCGYCC